MLGFRYDFKHICFSNNLYTGHIFCNVHSKEWRSRCIFGLQAITLVILTKANRTVCWQRKQEGKSSCTVWYPKLEIAYTLENGTWLMIESIQNVIRHTVVLNKRSCSHIFRNHCKRTNSCPVCTF